MREKICVMRPYFGRIFDENAMETQKIGVGAKAPTQGSASVGRGGTTAPPSFGCALVPFLVPFERIVSNLEHCIAAQ